MLELYGTALRSRLLLGTAHYPSPAVLTAAVRAARAEIVTVALRRESSGERAGQGFWSLIRGLGVRVLPNTAGCPSGKEPVPTAPMARQGFRATWAQPEAFRQAVEAGWAARLGGPIEPRDLAAPSTPVIGTAFRG